MEYTIISEGAGTAIVKTPPKKKFKCPYCDQRFERQKLHIHIQNEHEDLIPEGYTALRVAFNSINNKTEGHCIICKGVTDWNEDKGRYERLCNNQACHEAYKKMAAERNKDKYGVERLQTDPKYAEYVQKRALEGRKIAGVYKFTDGGEIKYLGTYEKKLLEFMDTVMHCKSEDIIAPGPSIEYIFEGKKHLYIPDFYYEPYGLIIEIKDGGSNPNNHPKRIEEEKKNKAKEDAVRDGHTFNYVRVVNNDFSQLLSIMAAIKFQMTNTTQYKPDPIIMVNEDYYTDGLEKYNVLPDNIDNIDDLLAWKNRFNNMSEKYRKESDSLSMDLYQGSINDRFNEKCSQILNDDSNAHNDYLSEAYIVNHKDIYYNKDKFDSGEINLCFITGHAGSGKSTMGNEMNKISIEHCELDDLFCVKDHFTMDELKKRGDLIYSFFNGQGKKYYLAMNETDNLSNQEYEDKLYPDFVNYAKQYAKSKKDKKFVIEGVELYWYGHGSGAKPLFEPSEFKDYAFYIKGTSMIISKLRSAKREANEAKKNKTATAIKDFILNNWKYYFIDEKHIKKFRDYFENLMKTKSINESEDESHLYDNYKGKGHKKLSDFKLVVSGPKKDDGKSIVLTWMDANKKVATVRVDTVPASDGYNWFGSLTINSEYRSYGLGDQIIDLITSKKYSAGALAVHKDNEIAIHLYKKHGFEISKSRKDKEYYYMYLKKNKFNNISEDMSGTIAAALPPAPTPHECNKDNYYIIQHPQNNVFAYGITKDPVQNTIYGVDPQEPGFYKVYKTDKTKIDKRYLTFKVKDSQSAKELYDELALLATNKNPTFHDNRYSSDCYTYSRLTEGSKIITPDQLLFDSRFELVKNPSQEINEACQKLYTYLKGQSKLIDILEEQINLLEDSNEYDMYNIMPDNINDVDELLKWKDKFDAMPYEYRMTSNDMSTDMYGSDNISRFNKRYSELINSISPEKNNNDVELVMRSIGSISESNISSDIPYDLEFHDNWSDKLAKVKDAESQGLIIMINSNVIGFDYTEDDIAIIKDKWNQFQSLPEDKRVLSGETASSIFGIDNDGLYSKILSIYAERVQKDIIDKKDYGTDDIVQGDYSSSQQLKEFCLKLRNTSDKDQQEFLKDKIYNLGWNPEIPYTDEVSNLINKYHPYPKVQILNAEDVLKESGNILNEFTSEDLKDKIVPVFIVLCHGVTLFSKGIMKFTNSQWSHAALSFDSSLDKMYTFAIDNSDNSGNNKTGFMIDTKEKYKSKDPHMNIKVCALFVTPVQRDKMQDAVQWYINNQNKTSYGFKNILNFLLKKPLNDKSSDKYSMVCSQFVYAILSIVNFKINNDKGNLLVSPEDISRSKDLRFYSVYQGGVDQYSREKVDQLCYKLLPKLPMDSYGLNESMKIIDYIIELANSILNDK